MCNCPFCEDMKNEKSGVRILWRKIMDLKKGKAPKLVVRERDKYVCPACLQESCSYYEEERLFMCSNEHCKKEFALIEVN